MLPTCEAWTLSQLALWSQGLTTVTLYETYGAEAIRFILNQTQLDTVITLGSKVQLLLDLQAGKHTLKTIVSM
jgi:long-subunit acyl-CoA synthetase (AMP-forming)